MLFHLSWLVRFCKIAPHLARYCSHFHPTAIVFISDEKIGILPSSKACLPSCKWDSLICHYQTVPTRWKGDLEPNLFSFYFGRMFSFPFCTEKNLVQEGCKALSLQPLSRYVPRGHLLDRTSRLLHGRFSPLARLLSSSWLLAVLCPWGRGRSYYPCPNRVADVHHRHRCVLLVFVMAGLPLLPARGLSEARFHAAELSTLPKLDFMPQHSQPCQPPLRGVDHGGSGGRGVGD